MNTCTRAMTIQQWIQSKNNSESDTDDDKSGTEDTNSEKEESLSQNDTNLLCKICNKQFAQYSNLVRHIQNIHPNNGQKRKSHETMKQGKNKVLKNENQCHNCNKTYSNKFNLNRHLKSHNGNLCILKYYSELFIKLNKCGLLICSFFIIRLCVDGLYYKLDGVGPVDNRPSTD